MSNSELTVKTLMDGLNKYNFAAFPQKNDSSKTTLSIVGDDGKRYFVTRVAAGINEDGSANYMWSRGKQFSDDSNK